MRWSLRKKILLGYGVALLLTGLVLSWAFVNLLRLGAASDAILSENYRSIIAAENMIDALERQDSGVLLYTLGFETEATEQSHQSQSEFHQWLARARDNVTIDGEAEIISTIDLAYAVYLLRVSEFIRGQADAGPGTETTYHDQLLPAFLRVREASADLRDLNERTMERASDRARRVADRALWSMSIVGLLTIVLGFIFSFILSNRLVQPIRNMRDAAERIAAGDYEIEVSSGYDDELGELATQFNDMAAKIRAFRDLNVERLMAEKKKSEAVIQSIDDGLVVVNQDLDIEDLNPAAGRILQTNRTDAVHSPLATLIRDDGVIREVRELVTSGVVREADEDEAYLTIEHGAEQRYFQYVVSPIPSKGAILLLRDVTKLKELDRLKSEFVATASHELKTPLTSIGMSIGLLLERAGSKLQGRELELLLAAAEDVERLRHLANDLLDLSKIEAGKIELEFEVVPVGLLFDKAVHSLKAQADERNISLTATIPDDIPGIRADANKITWVLTNLISNALRYTKEDGHVELSAVWTGSKVYISVRDDGEGIPYTYQSKIFDKFVQVGGKKSVGGSGLGLAISKEIVRAHGGSIWVQSSPGNGATFTFTIPVVV